MSLKYEPASEPLHMKSEKKGQTAAEGRLCERAAEASASLSSSSLCRLVNLAESEGERSETRSGERRFTWITKASPKKSFYSP